MGCLAEGIELVRLPKRTFTLPLGFGCSPSEISHGVWQHHIVKHPLGIHGKPAPWDHEGWDRTKPPVITQRRRKDLVEAIGALRVGSSRCLVPEFVGARPPVIEPDRSACDRCLREVRDACTRLCHEQDEVGTRYQAMVDALLEAVENGELVRRTEFITRVMAKAGARTADERIAVMSWGFADDGSNKLIARISRGDGIRVEFYLKPDRCKQLDAWRTTYREHLAGGLAKLGSPHARFLNKFPEVAPHFGAMSDRCIVARTWWRTHAS